VNKIYDQRLQLFGNSSYISQCPYPCYSVNQLIQNRVPLFCFFPWKVNSTTVYYRKANYFVKIILEICVQIMHLDIQISSVISLSFLMFCAMQFFRRLFKKKKLAVCLTWVKCLGINHLCNLSLMQWGLGLDIMLILPINTSHNFFQLPGIDLNDISNKDLREWHDLLIGPSEVCFSFLIRGSACCQPWWETSDIMHFWCTTLFWKFVYGSQYLFAAFLDSAPQIT